MIYNMIYNEFNASKTSTKNMKRLLRNLILGFLLLWLPLQGFASAGMSFCRHTHSQPAAAHASMADPHGMHHEGHDCDRNQGSSSASHQTLCDDCGYCHLGSAPALLSTPVGLDAAAGFSFKFAFDTHFQLFFPELPQRPPQAFIS